MTQENTTTVTIEKTMTQENTTNIVTLEAPLFIIFAEYLGYVSIFNKYAEEWCDGKIPEIHVQKLIIVEAKSILRQMKKDYEINDIHYFYEMFYPIILQELDEKLKKILIQ